MGIVVILVIVCLVIWFVGKIGTAKASSTVRQDPAMQQMVIQPMERWGRWDGSSTQMQKADEAFEKIKNEIGCTNPQTRRIYDETLRNRPFLIPLTAAYAFVVGEYLSSRGSGINMGSSPEADQKVTMMHVLFPGFAQFVDQKHGRSEAETILCITSNLMDLFL